MHFLFLFFLFFLFFFFGLCLFFSIYIHFYYLLYYIDRIRWWSRSYHFSQSVLKEYLNLKKNIWINYMPFNSDLNKQAQGSRSYIFKDNKTISLANLFQQYIKNLSEWEIKFLLSYFSDKFSKSVQGLESCVCFVIY